MKRDQTLIDVFMAQKGIKTDKELAERLGFSQQQLSYRLNGNLSMGTLEKLATYFDTTVKDLLR